LKYMVYCIFRSFKQPLAEMPVGIAGHCVSLVANNGLCAAVSRIADSDSSISKLLAYEKTVESLQRSRTVIPMRYGCLFEGEEQIIQFIEERRKTYEALLDELDGCVEMGIRLLLADTREKAPMVPSAGREPILPIPPAPGSAYLAAKKVRFEARDRVTAEQQRIAGIISDAVAGCYVRSKQEYSHALGQGLLSLYFLVPGSAVERFRALFRGIRLKESVRLLVSGPWPPYNFVGPSSAGAALTGVLPEMPA